MASSREEVGTNFFGGNFRDALRNSYVYGFKAEQNDSDWYRLKNILEDNSIHFQRANGKKHPSTFIRFNSLTEAENRFHRLYRFCRTNPKDCLYFFHIILALSPKVSLTEYPDVEKAFSELAKATGMSGQELDQFAAKVSAELNKSFKNGKKDGLRTRDLYCFYPEERVRTYNYKALIGRLHDLCDLGLIRQSSKFSFSLSERTPGQLLAEGRRANPQFEEHFRTALLFYSRYALLGEVGTFLLDRLGERKKEGKIIYFKYDNFMTAVYDYTLIDLTHAMEQRYWCRISYSEELKGETGELFCFPIEVRVGSVHGQECLAYYEPFSRSYDFLPLESIDKILFYKDDSVRDASLCSDKLEEDLETVRFALAHCFGTSVKEGADGNAKERPALHTVKGTADLNRYHLYDNRRQPEEWEEIKERICRAKWIKSKKVSQRGTKIEFEAETIDPSELSSWLLGFSDYLTDLRIDDAPAPDDFFQASDSGHRRSLPGEEERKKLNGLRPIDDALHRTLFHSVFSAEYHLFADVLTQMGHAADQKCAVFAKAKKGKGNEKDSVESFINNAFEKERYMTGDKTDLNFWDLDLGKLLEESENFGRFHTTVYAKKYPAGRSGYDRNMENLIYPEKGETVPEGAAKALLPIYAFDQDLDFYKDLLPLTKVETRWLLTILQDEKIGYFLTEEETAAVKEALKGPEDWKPFPMEKINFYDRTLPEKEQCVKEKKNLAKVLHAIREEHPIRVSSDYYPSGSYLPSALIFSKLQDCLYLYCLPQDDKAKYPIYQMRLSFLDSVKIEEDTSFDFAVERENLNFFNRLSYESFTIELPDRPELVNSILTEFTPWERTCTYDPSEEYPYRLTFRYQWSDGRNLAERLLSYEKEIHIPEPDQPLSRYLRWLRMKPSEEELRQIIQIHDRSFQDPSEEEYARLLKKGTEALKTHYKQKGIKAEPVLNVRQYWNWIADSELWRSPFYGR